MGLICLIVLAPPSLAHAQAKPNARRTANRVSGETIESHLGKGYDALKQDSYAVAAAEFRAALRIDPKLTLRARFPLGVALFEMHQPAEARKEFEAVQTAPPPAESAPAK